MRRQRKIKVLIIDDSALMRQMLTAVLEADPDIEVVGTAANALIARERIKALRPEVLTLDVEMPGMDGITFLERLMRLYPLPVVMVSSLTEKGAGATVRALELGAIDFVTKPHGAIREGVLAMVSELRAKIHLAAQAHVRSQQTSSWLRGGAAPAPVRVGAPMHRALIAIGASIGGPQAIAEILTPLADQTPPIIIVQHMPPGFTRHFAERLDKQCTIEVREAQDGDHLYPGMALLAPGGAHVALSRHLNGYAVRVFDADPVNRHRPSVDVLFESVASIAGVAALGIILTGMGDDGARGLRSMEQAGAYTIAQDKDTSVVFGMPEQAIRFGGVREVLPLEKIAARIAHWVATAARDQPGRSPAT